MKCPACGHDNIPGDDECSHCLADLTSLDGLESKTNATPIKEILKQPLLTLEPRQAIYVSPQTTLLQAVQKMNEIKSGCVIVEDFSGNVVGIVTERDVLYHMPHNLSDLTKIKVSDIMTTHVEVLKEDNALSHALHQMSVKKFRHIPVINKDNSLGIISVRDVLKFITKNLGKITPAPVKKTKPKPKKVVKKAKAKTKPKKTIKKSAKKPAKKAPKSKVKPKKKKKK